MIAFEWFDGFALSIATGVYELPLALASGSRVIKVPGFSPICSANAGNILKTNHALKCVAIDKAAIDLGAQTNATARMTDDCRRGIVGFLES